MRRRDAERMFRTEMSRHGLKGWSFGWTAMAVRTRAGDTPGEEDNHA